MLKIKRTRSIAVNAILNMFNTFLTMAFSLLTFPYASRVLQVENIGKVNYTNSIVSYFALIAALGFNTYAVREGSKIKFEKDKIDSFSCQIFSFNFITVIIAYILLTITILLNKRFHPLTGLFLTQSIVMINNWINVTWINVIFEDYIFITIRSIIVQLLSIILLYALVKSPEDYYIYASITVFSNTLVSILNYCHSRKYCKISLTTNINIKKHIKPVIVFFSNTLAVSIYLNSDTTMIGFMLDSYHVGLYTAAVKIYSAIRTLIASVYNVAVSRMSLYLSTGRTEKYKALLNKMINYIIMISIPATALIWALSKELIYLISGSSYDEAKYPLSILAFAFLFAVLGGLLAYCVEVPMGHEGKVLRATVISAIENICLNLIFIPLMGIRGTAMTTLLAEMTVFCVLLWGMRKQWKLFQFRAISLNIMKTLAATAPVYLIKYVLAKSFINSNILIIIFTTGCSFITFSIISEVIKNIWFESFLKSVLKKLHIRKGA